MGFLSNIFWRAATAVGGAFRTVYSSTIGAFLADSAIGYVAYAAYNWYMAENEQFFRDEVITKCMPLICMQNTRAEAMASMSVFADIDNSLLNSGFDKKRLAYMISIYSSSLTASKMGLTKVISDMVDDQVALIEGQVTDLYPDEKDATIIADAVKRRTVCISRVFQFCKMVGFDPTTVDFEEIEDLFAACVEHCFAHPAYSEWKDGDIRHLEIYAGEPSPLSFYTVVSDLREYHDVSLYGKLTAVCKGFHSMNNSSFSDDEKSSRCEWRAYLIDSLLEMLKTLILSHNKRVD